jgi:AraC-like DNA-binding protein
MQTSMEVRIPATSNMLWKKLAKNRWLYFIVLPGILYFLIFKYWPMYGIFIAFKDYQPFLGFWDSPFVGFKHFERLFSDSNFREFDSELTLEGCSSRINYHPHYVSRVFRQETGTNFGEYLTQYRIEMAKKWLKMTNMKISEIAECLKYNNSANFIRSFRKTVGMTPGQYREEGQTPIRPLFAVSRAAGTLNLNISNNTFPYANRAPIHWGQCC